MPKEIVHTISSRAYPTRTYYDMANPGIGPVRRYI